MDDALELPLAKDLPPEEAYTQEELAVYAQQIEELEDLYERGLVLKKDLLEAVNEEKRSALLASIKSIISKNT